MCRANSCQLFTDAARKCAHARISDQRAELAFRLAVALGKPVGGVTAISCHANNGVTCTEQIRQTTHMVLYSTIMKNELTLRVFYHGSVLGHQCGLAANA